MTAELLEDWSGCPDPAAPAEADPFGQGTASALPGATGSPLPGANPFLAALEDLPAVLEAARRPRAWLIEEILEEGQMLLLYGDSGCGKSFAAMDMAFSLAMGREWAHRFAVPAPRPIVYLTAEGTQGARRRLLALATDHDTMDAPVTFAPMVPNLFDGGGGASAQNLLAALDVRGIQPPGLTVIDTLACASTGGDESATKDAQLIVANAGVLQKAGWAVAILHHATRATGRERGSTVYRASADAVIEATCKGGIYTLKSSKSKDGMPFADLHFTLTSIGESAVATWREGGDEGEDEAAREDCLPDRVRRALTMAPDGLTAGELEAMVGATDKAILGALGKMGTRVRREVRDPSKPKSNRNPYVWKVAPCM